MSAAFFIGLYLLLTNHSSAREPDPELDMPRQYTYASLLASNGMELHVIATLPDNVKPELIENNVARAPYYGVNGGFFYQDSVLSMSMWNGLPVNEEGGSYGSGRVNAKYDRGTLVWDGALDRLSIQVVSSASQLVVSDSANYWAQGGISMSLNREEEWLVQTELEHAPLPDNYCLRSAAVYDTEGVLYLVVSTTKGTLAQFREAILERVGDSKLEDGIFLDGDGSSQLRTREAKLSGDGRPVVQMLRLLR